ncbi:unnamed protein product [Didymodactylos carnosus]|uniref:Putative auto-transporter adhesin head GIN domain-containing protein n=1 Tax=Didymodactylos carnosus TaxID=1234261 RepID=A0A814E824_9BILA|nr:unnamed protein product [Didymodactylos carnosus]CAF0965937.1 unnamed protein product [Didymodactylos carnosus]CAF3654870.1 unnamed protein product [Didymodactylos carnosus]CAF3739503.1 unnamed protein product [Didymodactylos carnosus]
MFPTLVYYCTILSYFTYFGLGSNIISFNKTTKFDQLILNNLYKSEILLTQNKQQKSSIEFTGCSNISDFDNFKIQNNHILIINYHNCSTIHVHFSSIQLINITDSSSVRCINAIKHNGTLTVNIQRKRRRRNAQLSQTNIDLSVQTSNLDIVVSSIDSFINLKLKGNVDQQVNIDYNGVNGSLHAQSLTAKRINITSYGSAYVKLLAPTHVLNIQSYDFLRTYKKLNAGFAIINVTNIDEIHLESINSRCIVNKTSNHRNIARIAKFSVVPVDCTRRLFIMDMSLMNKTYKNDIFQREISIQGRWNHGAGQMLLHGCNSPTDSQTDSPALQMQIEDDIIETVFRYQFENNLSSQRQNAHVYCLRINGIDPLPSFLYRFRSDPKVRPVSLCTISDQHTVYETQTQLSGLVFYVTRPIQMLSKDEARVMTGYWEGNLSSQINEYLVARQNDGKWMVIKNIMGPIS